MGWSNLIILSTLAACAYAWSYPFYPVRGPIRVTRFAQHPPPHVIHHLRQQHHRAPAPAPVHDSESMEEEWTRSKRERDHDSDDDYGYKGHDYKGQSDYDSHGGHSSHRPTSGVTGPVHTFVKTDKNANYKWGVRHHVGNKYAS